MAGGPSATGAARALFAQVKGEGYGGGYTLVNATVAFEALADEIHKPAKSLHRMLSKSGNPTMSC